MVAVYRFIHSECGQDLSEYTLLISLIAVAIVMILIQTAYSLVPIWTAGNTMIQNAALQIK
jgi:Flp pilus assembly pilin Flp